MPPLHHLVRAIGYFLKSWARRAGLPNWTISDRRGGRSLARPAFRWVVLGVEMVEARLAANDMLHATTTALLAAAPAALSRESAPAFRTVASTGAASGPEGPALYVATAAAT